MSIETLDHRALQEHRAKVDRRIHHLEEEALRTLSHRPFGFAWLLILQRFGIATAKRQGKSDESEQV